MAKHVFVTGGVVSSLGKGITAASLGRLLKSRGFKVTLQKADPYLNVDPGTMSPFQHGEVFVTDDGHEGDLDLGHYERFIDESLTSESNFTAGLIYQSLIASERRGDFRGGTVQVIPQMTNAIKDRLTGIAEQSQADFVITEIGGTVGDIESLPFIEAARQFKMSKPLDDVLFVHVTLVPYIEAAGELKTKPTQHSIKELRSIGVQPDFIICRSDRELHDKVREKIALYCDVKMDNVINAIDVSSIYQVPLNLYAQGFDVKVLEALRLEAPPIDLSDWQAYVDKSNKLEGAVDIAVVGKYISAPDAYLSVIEAFKHTSVYYGRKVNVHLVDGEALNDSNVEEKLASMDGILIPGGFGIRAFEGKIRAAQYARENKVPFLGISLGLHAAVCEFARSVAGMKNANSIEFESEEEPSLEYPVISLISEHKIVGDLGGTLRLGAHPCKLLKGSKAFEAYSEEIVYERHRQRYQINNDFRQRLVDAGLVLCGLSLDDELVEMIELADHPWFVACQGHPEFKSRPTRPHPLFNGLAGAAIAHREQR